MDKKKLNTASNSVNGAKPKQMPAITKGKMATKQTSSAASVSSFKTTTTTKKHSSEDSSSIPIHTLFWLDSNINMKDDDCNRTITQLRSVISTLHVFDDSNECENFLHTIPNQKVFMVASGSLGQYILGRVHHLPQLTAAFIYCSDRSKYESLPKSWPKVQGIFTDMTNLCESLKRATRQCVEDSIDISLVSESDISGQRLDQLDQSFMYTQLIKQILFELEYNDKNFKELVTYSLVEYSKNAEELKMIEQFQNEYKLHSPIWWYTMECFLYKMLNDALRNQKSDVIIKMGFFLCDLHGHIAILHSKQLKEFSKQFTVYRGQGMPQEKLDKMKKTNGGLMSFNNFLSTSLDLSVAMDFVDRAFKKSMPYAVLFTITIDPSISSAPFAKLDKVSYYEGEKEILFSMHSIFRIGDIKQSNEDNRLWHVRLTLTSDSDKQLNRLLERMRVEIGGSSPSYRLGALMIKLGDFKKAEEVYRSLLECTPDELERANLYFQLGYINDNQGDYRSALQFYQDALTIYLNYYSPEHQNIATCYNNIGLVYDNMKDYREALKYYQKALEIYQKTSSNDHSNLANSYNSIGMVYNSMGDYSKALKFCQQAFDIFKESLPSNHPTLATSHNNLGLVYDNMKKYSEAYASYKHAVGIGQQTLPANHPNLELYKRNFETLRKKANK